MKQKMRIGVTLLLAAGIAVTPACGAMNGTGWRKTPQAAPEPQTVNPSTPSETGTLSGPEVRLLQAEEGTIPIVTVDGKKMISAAKLAELLDYQQDWDAAAGKLRMGDNDAEYELTGGSKQAVMEGGNVTLPEAPQVHQGTLYVPVDALGDIFRHDVFSYNLREGEVALHPAPGFIDKSVLKEPPEPAGKTDEFSFADDPDDPYRNAETPVWLPEEAEGAFMAAKAYRQTDESRQALKNIDMNDVISTAKRYLGISYLFGADPYPKSGKFDCSTFTQYVYGKKGITLPRTARAQARQGVLTSRKLLRKGDLLFFYVPGRFKSDKTIGHVGIYMGNNEMIHSSPAPDNGVQISNINQAYWKKTFLTAKRVGS
ncbi:NlpC/P60 family protein [Paenibacillus hodogayensis]|uniref:NlpC/P60 family protein n=1 Tax=Paenibacillus hodogayensis TaxID=279208 RepID=A0ABV5W8C2_9BACL